MSGLRGEGWRGSSPPWNQRAAELSRPEGLASGTRMRGLAAGVTSSRMRGGTLAERFRESARVPIEFSACRRRFSPRGSRPREDLGAAGHAEPMLGEERVPCKRHLQPPTRALIFNSIFNTWSGAIKHLARDRPTSSVASHCCICALASDHRRLHRSAHHLRTALPRCSVARLYPRHHDGRVALKTSTQELPRRVRIGRVASKLVSNSDGCSGSANTRAKSSGVKARTKRVAYVSRKSRA
jgi:hypothetical protein